MNRIDDQEILAGLRPAMLDQLAESGYDRNRDSDLARAFAERAGHQARPGSPPRRSHGAQHRPWLAGRSRRLAVVGLGAAAAVALVVAAVLVPAASSPAPQRAGAPALTMPQHEVLHHGTALPNVSSRMRLASAASVPFRPSGTAADSTDGDLECVTAAVCYAAGSDGAELRSSERTSDGGVTWQQTAPLPDHLSLVAGSTWLSCATADFCTGLVANPGPPRFARTANGGRSWRIESLPVPSGMRDASIGQVSCPTARTCVASIANRSSNVFLASVNGGRTWSAAPGQRGGVFPWLLRCDAAGRCIALAPMGKDGQQLEALRSADSGRTWSTSVTRLPRTAILLLSCGDTLHCMAITTWSGMMLTTTSDGGVTWHQSAAPRSWPGTATAVSCTTGLDCFIAVADYTNSPHSTYLRPAIEATYNDGTTWTEISLPSLKPSPLALLQALSCPTSAGCIGFGDTIRHFEHGGPPIALSNLPAAGQGLTGR